MSDKIRRFVLPNVPYLFIFWCCLKLGTAYHLAAGAGFGEKLIGMVKTVGPAFQTIAPGLIASDWLVGLAGAVILRLVVFYKIKKTPKSSERMWNTGAPDGVHRKTLNRLSIRFSKTMSYSPALNFSR
jgi:hypothetical protein